MFMAWCSALLTPRHQQPTGWPKPMCPGLSHNDDQQIKNVSHFFHKSISSAHCITWFMVWCTYLAQQHQYDDDIKINLMMKYTWWVMSLAQYEPVLCIIGKLQIIDRNMNKNSSAIILYDVTWGNYDNLLWDCFSMVCDRFNQRGHTWRYV